MKRFTETSKWNDPWFFELEIKYQLLWLFILDQCDNAGIWTVNRKVAEFFLKHHFDWNKVMQVFSSRIIIVSRGSKWWIRKFIDYQYGELSENCKPHQSVIKTLKKERVWKGYRKGSYTLQEKEKEKNISLYSNNIDKECNTSYMEYYYNIVKDLNYVLGTNYRATTPKTQKLIRARLKEGFLTEDFKTVHRKMLKDWGDDPKMVKYLRPETLYGTKFENYLNQKETTTKLTKSGIRAFKVGQKWLEKNVE